VSGISDVAIIVIGAGGALATLTATLRAWLARDRRTVVRIESGEKTIVIDAANIDQESLRRILQDVTADIKQDKENQLDESESSDVPRSDGST
jgi:hypothetical protein